MRSAWSIKETESAGCLWGYSMINALLPLQKKAVTTLSVLTGFEKGIWIFCVGYLGFWGLKSKALFTEDALKLLSGFLEQCSVNDTEDFEHSDVILSLTVLFLWVNQLPKSEYTEKILNSTLQLLSSSSFKSRGNVQLFWSDSLLPIFSPKVNLKSILKKVKNFSNLGANPLRDLLQWVYGIPGLMLALEESMRELVVNVESEEGGGGEGEEGEGEVVVDVYDEQDEKDARKSQSFDGEVLTVTIDPASPIGKTKKRKIEPNGKEIGVGEKKGESRTVIEKSNENNNSKIMKNSVATAATAAVEDDVEDDIEDEVALFEMDYAGDAKSVMEHLAEDIKVRN
jgi:hypothetical protein